MDLSTQRYPTLTVGLSNLEPRYPTHTVGLYNLELRYSLHTVGLYNLEPRYPTHPVGLYNLELSYPILTVGLSNQELRYPILTVGLSNLELRYPILTVGVYYMELRYSIHTVGLYNLELRYPTHSWIEQPGAKFYMKNQEYYLYLFVRETIVRKVLEESQTHSNIKFFSGKLYLFICKRNHSSKIFRRIPNLFNHKVNLFYPQFLRKMSSKNI